MSESTTRSTVKEFKVASWNVQKITYSVDKLSKIFDTLTNYDVDFALLQETNIQHGYEEQYKKYTLIFPKYKMMNNLYFYGVAVAVKNELRSAIQYIPVHDDVSDKIMHCVIHNTRQHIHFINVYAPRDINSLLYDHLKKILCTIDKKSPVFLFGDFNAHVGWNGTAPACLGKHCVYKKPNDQGTKLIKFCDQKELMIFNTFFNAQREEKMTHFNISGHSSEIDFLIARPKDFLLIKPYLEIYPEVTITDHCILVCTVIIHLEVPIYIEKSYCLKVNIVELIILLSEKTVEVTYDLWKDTKSELAKLFDSRDIFENIYYYLYYRITNAISALEEFYEHYAKDQKVSRYSVKQKMESASNLIKLFLESLKSPNTVKIGSDIEPTLLKIIQCKKIVKINIPSKYVLDWDTVTKLPPSKEKVKRVMDIFDKNRQYFFFFQSIYPLVIEIWSKGNVPLELSMCVADVVKLDGGVEPKENAVAKLIYNVIHYILIARLESQISFLMKSNDTYTFFLSNNKSLSNRRLKKIFGFARPILYMALIDFNNFDDKAITQLLLTFLESSGLPKRMIDLISYFTFCIKQANGVLEKYLSKLSVSIACHNVFQKVKSKHKNRLDIRAVYVNDKLLIVSSSSNLLTRCLTQLDLHHHMMLPKEAILTQIKFYICPIVDVKLSLGNRNMLRKDFEGKIKNWTDIICNKICIHSTREHKPPPMKFYFDPIHEAEINKIFSHITKKENI